MREKDGGREGERKREREKEGGRERERKKEREKEDGREGERKREIERAARISDGAAWKGKERGTE